MLPSFVLAPWAGVIVDRLPRRTVMIAADLIRAVIALGLLLTRDASTAWIAYACVAGLSAFSALFEPARTAVTPNLTREEELVTANALSAVTWSIMLTSGALVGGLVGRFLGTDVAFVLNSASFLVSAALIARISSEPIEKEKEKEEDKRRGSLAEGMAYVRRHPAVAGALSAKLLWAMAGGIQVLLPVFGAKVFPLTGDKAGQRGISLLFAAGGFGTALGPIAGRRWSRGEPARMRWAIAGSFLMASLYYAAMSRAWNLAGVGALLACARFHGSIIWVFSTVLLQMTVDDAYRGRVFALEMSLFTGMMMTSAWFTTMMLDHRWATPSQMVLFAAGASLLGGIGWVVSLSRQRAPRPTFLEGGGGE
jgi:MFS family permease